MKGGLGFMSCEFSPAPSSGYYMILGEEWDVWVEGTKLIVVGTTI
jgi:hypothetical protein